MPEIEDILNDRGSRYGDFETQSETAQAIRRAFKASPNWEFLPAYAREGLDLVATKISRMLCGDPLYLDNVVDILGYMTLVKTEMEKEHARREASMRDALERNRRLAEAAMQRDPEVQSYYKDLADAALHHSPLNWAGPYRNS